MSEPNEGPNGPANIAICLGGIAIAAVVLISNPVLFITICVVIGVLGGLHFVCKF